MHKKILPSQGMSKTNFKDFDEYQKWCKKVAIYPKQGKHLVYPIVGLSEEAGEIAGKYKKLVRDHKGKLTKDRKMEIAKEMGDALWYLAMLAFELKIKLSDVVKLNIEKVKHREKENKIHGSGDNR